MQGVIGATIFIFAQIVAVTAAVGIGLCERCLGPNAEYLSFIFTIPVLAGTILFFLYFLASFSGQEGKRPFVLVIAFVVLNLVSVITLYANLYKISGIQFGDNLVSVNNFPECIYFSVVTFTTVGYGDYHPMSGAARIVAAFEALSGYIILGILVSALVNILRPRQA